MNSQGIGMTSLRARERLINRLKERGITDSRVLLAIKEVPRHLFLDEALASRAYEDTALPIDNGQTISQPYIVAFMTELLLKSQQSGKVLDKVLEVGTGSGYQAAVLSKLCKKVYSMERIKPLHLQAQKRLRNLGYRNLLLRHVDGHEGWESKAPFDGIIVTAAATHIPEHLLEQLNEGASLVIPLVRDGNKQVLECITRREDHYERESIAQVVFVPMLQGLHR